MQFGFKSKIHNHQIHSPEGEVLAEFKPNEVEEGERPEYGVFTTEDLELAKLLNRLVKEKVHGITLLPGFANPDAASDPAAGASAPNAGPDAGKEAPAAGATGPDASKDSGKEAPNGGKK